MVLRICTPRRVSTSTLLLFCVGLALGSCRVRKMPDPSSDDPQISADEIHAPLGVQLDGPFIGPLASGNRTRRFPPAVLVALGFGDLGYAGVRQAQLEGEWLLEHFAHQDNPFGALATGLRDVALRRWSTLATSSGAVHMALSETGQVTLRGEQADTLLQRALGSLSLELAKTPAPQERGYDWSPLGGPLIALARASSGEIAVIALNGDLNAMRPKLAYSSDTLGAVAVVCDCPNERIVRAGVEQLRAALGDAAALGREAAKLRDSLREASEQQARHAVLVLSDHGVLVEASATLVYGSAGTAMLERARTEPDQSAGERHTSRPPPSSAPGDAGVPRAVTDAGTSRAVGERADSAAPTQIRDRHQTSKQQPQPGVLRPPKISNPPPVAPAPPTSQLDSPKPTAPAPPATPPRATATGAAPPQPAPPPAPLPNSQQPGVIKPPGPQRQLPPAGSQESTP